MKYSDEQIARLQIIRTSKIGPKTFFDLFSIHKSGIKILKELEKNHQIYDKDLVLKEIKEASEFGARYIFWDEEEYPKLLLQIDNPPPVLNVIGDISFLNQENLGAIAIVGSRNCSLVGKKLTEYFARELALRNFAIISGMAAGIDQAAHEQIIEMNLKDKDMSHPLLQKDFKNAFKTIAVLGSGIKNPYPSQNFMKRILNSGGAIISEFSFFETPKKENFPMRNRILSGISHATLVIEASDKSGSMISARFAASQGRPVFSIPGSPIDQRSSGTNKLIKDGAILTRDIHDILEEMNQFFFIDHGSKQLNLLEDDYNDEFSNHSSNQSDSKISPQEAVLAILDYKIPTETEEILSSLKKDYGIDIVFSGIIRILTMMELDDLIRKSELGGFVKI